MALKNQARSLARSKLRAMPFMIRHRLAKLLVRHKHQEARRLLAENGYQAVPCPYCNGMGYFPAPGDPEHCCLVETLAPPQQEWPRFEVDCCGALICKK